MSGRLRKRNPGSESLPNTTIHGEHQPLDGGDKRKLSYRALGVLLALHARPEGASYDMRVLAAGPGREGRNALLAPAKELRELGFMGQRKVRGSSGRIITLVVIDKTPMSAETIADELDDMARDEVIHRAAPGSDNRTPVDRTPVDRTPVGRTILPTGGHPSYYVEETNAGACEHGEPRGPRACALCRYAARSAS